MDPTTRLPFQVGLCSIAQVTSLKPVKGSSKVPYFNTCPHYYYALHKSIYIYIHIYVYTYIYRKSRISTPL